MTHTPAGKLVSAFGDPQAMAQLYAPEIQWSLSAALTQFPRPMIGRDAVIALNEAIWTDTYRPDCVDTDPSVAPGPSGNAGERAPLVAGLESGGPMDLGGGHG